MDPITLALLIGSGVTGLVGTVGSLVQGAGAEERYKDLQDQTIKMLKQQGKEAKESAIGVATANVEEGLSNAELSNRRAGISGPVSSALEQRSRGRLSRDLANISKGIDANTTNSIANVNLGLGQEQINAAQNRDIAFQNTLSQLATTGAQIAGTLYATNKLNQPAKTLPGGYSYGHTVGGYDTYIK